MTKISRLQKSQFYIDHREQLESYLYGDDFHYFVDMHEPVLNNDEDTDIWKYAKEMFSFCLLVLEMLVLLSKPALGRVELAKFAKDMIKQSCLFHELLKAGMKKEIMSIINDIDIELIIKAMHYSINVTHDFLGIEGPGDKRTKCMLFNEESCKIVPTKSPYKYIKNIAFVLWKTNLSNSIANKPWEQQYRFFEQTSWFCILFNVEEEEIESYIDNLIYDNYGDIPKIIKDDLCELIWGFVFCVNSFKEKNSLINDSYYETETSYLCIRKSKEPVFNQSYRVRLSANYAVIFKHIDESEINVFRDILDGNFTKEYYLVFKEGLKGDKSTTVSGAPVLYWLMVYIFEPYHFFCNEEDKRIDNTDKKYDNFLRHIIFTHKNKEQHLELNLNNS